MSKIILRELQGPSNFMVCLSNDLHVMESIHGGGFFSSDTSINNINNVITTINNSVVIGVQNGPLQVTQVVNAPR
jgi:hypothetical protein